MVCAKETQIYSALSFPRKRETSQIKHLDSRFRGNDELICASLKKVVVLQVVGVVKAAPSFNLVFANWNDSFQGD